MQWKKWQCWAAPALLAVVTAAAYHNSFSGPFIFDDVEAIEANPHIRQLWPVWEAGRAPQDTTLSRRPVTTLTFAINYAISGQNVGSYHAFNLLIQSRRDSCYSAWCGERWPDSASRPPRPRSQLFPHTWPTGWR